MIKSFTHYIINFTSAKKIDGFSDFASNKGLLIGLLCGIIGIVLLGVIFSLFQKWKEKRQSSLSGEIDLTRDDDTLDAVTENDGAELEEFYDRSDLNDEMKEKEETFKDKMNDKESEVIKEKDVGNNQDMNFDDFSEN